MRATTKLFCSILRFLVTFPDALVALFVTFLPNSFCQTPFVAGRNFASTSVGEFMRLILTFIKLRAKATTLSCTPQTFALERTNNVRQLAQALLTSNQKLRSPLKGLPGPQCPETWRKSPERVSQSRQPPGPQESWKGAHPISKESESHFLDSFFSDSFETLRSTLWGLLGSWRSRLFADSFRSSRPELQGPKRPLCVWGGGGWRRSQSNGMIRTSPSAP